MHQSIQAVPIPPPPPRHEPQELVLPHNRDKLAVIMPGDSGLKMFIFLMPLVLLLPKFHLIHAKLSLSYISCLLNIAKIGHSVGLASHLCPM